MHAGEGVARMGKIPGRLRRPVRTGLSDGAGGTDTPQGAAVRSQWRRSTDPADGSEATLLTRAAAGDAAAFVDVCLPHFRPAFNLALALSGDRDVAADICQDALARTYVARACARPRGREVAALHVQILRYVYELSSRTCRSGAFRGGRPPGQSPSPFPAYPHTPMEADADAEIQALLPAALERLEMKTRAAIWLHDGLGLSFADGAAVLEEAVSTFRRDLRLARARLRAILRSRPGRGADSASPADGPEDACSALNELPPLV